MISPVSSGSPVASLTATLCGTPASLLLKWIWNGVSAVTVTSVWSKAVGVVAEISTIVPPAGPLGAGEAPGEPLGAAEAPGEPDAPGDPLGAARASTQHA